MRKPILNESYYLMNSARNVQTIVYIMIIMILLQMKQGANDGKFDP